MTYDRSKEAGNILSEVTFDRIIFMNSLALNGARTNRQCGRSNILEEMVSIFFLTLRRVLDKKLYLREICLIEV